ncbi:dihydrofolate reductase family protein [Brevibacterium daeguense]|uniref:Dihydrofolate reductase family protein n=1 Tax=Brevibacterium daeguense TaxID=909936 RepID=A0ABP8EG53_9MICO|nr:dihydrofolate reductase family protein [Brevibacterium daeguense]
MIDSPRTRSPELLVDFIVSLDGYGTADGWPGWWGLEGPEYLKWLEEQPEGAYTLLLGANTYRQMSEMSGAAAGGQSEFSDDEEASLSGLAAVPKIVCSSTLTTPLAWPNTELVSGDAVAAVAEMKRTGTRSLRTLGSVSLCRSLMAAGLVDRFRLVIFPVITGSTGQDRIYDGYQDFALEMIDSRTFDGRLQLVEYTPTVLTGPHAHAPASLG